MSTITFDKATRLHPGASTPAVSALDFTVENGEFVAVVGPSGCGKSTTLRMVTGLEPVTEGDILIDAKSTRKVAPSKRDVAMVFQTYALYPHMSVAENMGFALKMRKVPKSERQQRVEEAAAMLDLTKYLDRRPKELSGGQRQRVAMGRAIVRQPKVFLMDEPLSNLDAKLRVSTRAQIAELQRRLAVTTIYVTHDQTEAMTMADRIAVLNQGVLMQIGSPRELYDRPANLFVAGFLGTPSMNLLALKVDADTAFVGEHRLNIPTWVIQQSSTAEVTLGIRPEDFRPLSAESVEAQLQARVDFVEDTGSDAFARATITGAQGPAITVRYPASEAPHIGEIISLAVPEECVFWFDTASGKALRK